MTGGLFLDRDGVICRALVRGGKPFPPQTLQELEILPGVKQALQKAGAMGLVRVIVTNQPDVARGTLDREMVEAMHNRLRAELQIDDFLVCWHDDADACACRKPKPGLLLEGAKRHGVDLAKS
ncbi:MAG TPA: HAD-IIIA family hydrolase, partial [Polyangia bacterium]